MNVQKDFLVPLALSCPLNSVQKDTIAQEELENLNHVLLAVTSHLKGNMSVIFVPQVFIVIPHLDQSLTLPLSLVQKGITV